MAGDVIRTLSESDIATLRWVIDRERKRIRNTQGRPAVPEHLYQTRNIHVALTPRDGIPPLVADLNIGTGTGSGTGTSIGYGNSPGQALCEMWTVSETHGVFDLTPAYFDEIVLNISEGRIPGNIWVLVVMDSDGNYHAVSGLPIVGPTTIDDKGCTLASLFSSDCLLAICDNGKSFILSSNHNYTWTAYNVPYPLGTGTLTASWNSSTGLLDLTLDGKKLLNCERGCYSGGPMTGHVYDPTTDTGTANDPIACSGTKFTICLCCIGCIGTGTGTPTTPPGTGTGTGSGASTCCNRSIPANLTVSFSGTTVPIHNSATIGQPGYDTWEYIGPGAATTCIAPVTTCTFQCIDGASNIVISFGSDNAGGGAVTILSCSPFLATATVNFASGVDPDPPCYGSGVAVTITE